MAERTVNGRVMIWHGHRVERLGEPGSYRYRTLCGADAPMAYLCCGDELYCMSCALILDQEKLAALTAPAGSPMPSLPPIETPRMDIPQEVE